MTTAANDSGDGSEFSGDLQRAAEGDQDARQRLWSTHYEMLHQCAKAWFTNHWQRRGAQFGVSLDGTDIVNAAYERLHDRTAAMANGKAYFFRAFYTECMRIVVDHYRKTKNDKGRGKQKRAEFQSQFLVQQRVDVDFDRLYALLSELERLDARVGQVAMLKVFENRPDERKAGGGKAGDGRAGDGENGEPKPGPMRGLTNAEIATLMGIGLRTVEQDWAFAKAWLMKQLGQPPKAPDAET